MKKIHKRYEIGIIGGGLAGLVSAIHLTKSKKSVLLIEKHVLPRHKVCGEYISMEVYEYLKSLGIDVFEHGAKRIKRFQFSTANGKMLESELGMGGFGISRYKIDKLLWEIACVNGVECVTDEALNVSRSDTFEIVTKSKKIYCCDIVIGAQGKRSKLDKNLNREFINTRTPWIGVKAHYAYKMPADLVSLHHFKGGYCGLSMVEDQRVNACYLIHQSMFEKHGSIESLEKNVLCTNPRLYEFFSQARPVFERPLSISQIYFGNREKAQDGLLFMGDAAGMIHPLAGNGMAMAIHSAKILSSLIVKYSDKLTLQEISEKYHNEWNAIFKKRVTNGARLHKLLEYKSLSSFAMRLLPLLPSVLPTIIKQTHGDMISPFE